MELLLRDKQLHELYTNPGRMSLVKIPPLSLPQYGFQEGEYPLSLHFLLDNSATQCLSSLINHEIEMECNDEDKIVFCIGQDKYNYAAQASLDAYSLAVLEKFINHRNREAPITVEVCSFQVPQGSLDYILLLLAHHSVFLVITNRSCPLVLRGIFNNKRALSHVAGITFHGIPTGENIHSLLTDLAGALGSFRSHCCLKFHEPVLTNGNLDILVLFKDVGFTPEYLVVDR